MYFSHNRNIIAGAIMLLFLLIAGGIALHAANGSVTFTYDALGRIATASYDTGVFVTYTYDANGNRTAQTTNVNTTHLQWCTGGTCAANNYVWGQAIWWP